MIVLESNTRLTSKEQKLAKMSDSNSKDEVVEEKTETSKPLSNGTEEEKEEKVLKVENDSKPEDKTERMDVDGEETPAESTEVNEEKNKKKEGSINDEEGKIPSRAQRKSRSSRSQSSNSSTSTPTPDIAKDGEDKKTENIPESKEAEEEDFFGFETLESEVEKIKANIDLLKKKAGIKDSESISDEGFSGFGPIESHQEEEKPAINEKTPAEKPETGPVNSESHQGEAEASSSGIKSRPSRPSSKKSISSIDLSNPMFKKPLEHGWVRELVYRSSTDVNSPKRSGDVYYYTPSGKRVRSSREIVEFLTGDLTLENFTFFKEPVGANDPAKEIIREAKAKPGPKNAAATDAEGTASVKKGIPKVKASTAVKESPKTVTPKVVFRPNATPKSRASASGKSKLDKKRKSAGPDDVDVDVMVESAEWSPDGGKVNPGRDVCGIECRLAMGIIPTLQCVKCLCLFHPACVGIQPEKLKPSHSYVCKNCHKMKTLPPPAPPDPVPIAPKITPLVPTYRPPPQPLMSQTITPSNITPNISRPAGIVGTVTTWLPPSSSIHCNKTNSEMNETSFKDQGEISTEGSDFIAVRNFNVVSVNAEKPDEIRVVSNPPGLYLVPCEAPHHQALNGPHSPSLANGIKRSLDSPADSTSPPEKKSKSDRKDKGEEKEEKEERAPSSTTPAKVSPSSQHFMMNLNAGFVALLHAFQYLKVYELLRASCVSKMWHYVASHQSLWETVRMKNSRVSDWEGFGRALASHGTKNLDLRKMLVPESLEDQTKMWQELSKAVKGIKTLTKIDLGRCSPAAFTSMASAAPQLESLVSLAINGKEKHPPSSTSGSRRRGNEIDLQPITQCHNLTELKLKALSGGLEVKDLSCLKDFPNLTTLALTTVKNLRGIEEFLPQGLVSLELGECSQLSEAVATDVLPKLKKLKRLRLEKGQGDCPTMALLDAISGLPDLKQLELINFDIKPGFDKALSKCTNIRILLIIPTYVTQSATTNHVVMGGVAKLSHTLTYFIWGLTLELLKVTDLFIGQVENQKSGKAGPPAPKKGTGDSIPILKPSQNESGEFKEGSQAPSQVDILALPNLQRVLSTLLPSTKIKILKVPFSATWRQTVTDA